MKVTVLLNATMISIILAFGSPAAQATPVMPPSVLQPLVVDESIVLVARRVVRRGTAVVGPRGGAVVHGRAAAVGPRGRVARRGTVVVGPNGRAEARTAAVVRPGYHGGGVRWVRPARYAWRPGGAIAAGAAIGFVAAAAAVAWAGAPPSSGLCWYYTDASRTNGFWDTCP